MEHTKRTWRVDEASMHEGGEIHIFAWDGSHKMADTTVATAMTMPDARLIAAAPEGFEAAEEAYIALLRAPALYRIDVQGQLCHLRDYLAKATNSTSEVIQNKYEALAKAKG